MAAVDQNSRPGKLGVVCVMVGPGPQAQGGVASVVKVYADAGLLGAGRVVLLESYSNAGKWKKLKSAASALNAFLAVLLHGQGQVLHVHVSSRASFWRKAVFIWVASAARRRIVFHLHGGGFRAFVEGLNPLARRLALATLRSSDVLLCLSTPVSEWLRSVAPGIPVRWWPNPVPTELFDAELDHHPDPQNVLFLGALLPAKGVDDLLQGFAALWQLRPQARLVLAGSGPEEPVLRRRVDELGLSSCVSFAGWLGPQAKLQALAGARMLVLPSHLEAQPMVLLEAMAAGVPVVSTAVGGVPDLISDGDHGLLVPPKDPAALCLSMLRLWDDSDLRGRLAQHARLRVAEQHRADRVCEALMNLYSSLAAGRTRSPGTVEL